jgi:hypothetical protein
MTSTMTFKYLSAYKVQGVSTRSTDPDILLLDRPDLGMKATLTWEVDRHLHPRDRYLALATLMLTGQLNADDVDEILNADVEEIRSDRVRRLGADGAVVIEIEGVVEIDQEPMRKFEQFDLYNEVVDKEGIREQFKQDITAFISALSIASGGTFRTDKLADGIHLVNTEGRIAYSVSVSADPVTAYVARAIDSPTIEGTRRYSDLLIGNQDLEKVSTLFAQSLETQTDRFRKFIFVWTALEILVSKVFGHYERSFIDALIGESSMAGAKEYFERVTEVMKSRYRLVDKFSVFATILAGEDGLADIEKIKRIKRIRDAVFHGEDVPDSSLPTDELQELVGRYLHKHLDRISSR